MKTSDICQEHGFEYMPFERFIHNRGYEIKDALWGYRTVDDKLVPQMVEEYKQELARIEKEKEEKLAREQKAFIENQNIELRFQGEESLNFGNVLYVNKAEKKFAIRNKEWFGTIHSFSELSDYSIVEDGNQITSSNAGAAAVGMLLLGASGAIIGSSKSKTINKNVYKLDVVLVFEGFDAEIEVIHLIDEPVDKGSQQYAEIADLCTRIEATLKNIMAEKDKDSTITSDKGEKARAIYAFSVADEILKFKKLADDGIITEDEFQAQKQKLLSLDY